MSESAVETVRTSVWQEEPEPDSPFAARVARCRGYDVYGQMLGQARWVDMLWLLFREDLPSSAEAGLLEALAVALANPGPRDASVHAAMCAGVGRSTAAASLIAALAAGAGQLGGGREVFLAMSAWAACGTNSAAWQRYLAGPLPTDPDDIWPEPEHPPGFDPHGVSATLPVQQTLACLAGMSPGPHLPWLQRHRAELEELTRCPLAMSGVASAAFADLQFAPAQGEVLHLLLRLPGAAAHALEQRRHGYRKFPFGRMDRVDDDNGESA